MFIRRTQTRNSVSGEPYVTHRLVHSTRAGNAIKQTTVLNLGSHFDLPQEHWPALARRVGELLLGQRSMLDATLPEQVQAFAQRFAAQIIARKPAVPSLGSAPTVPAVLADPAPAKVPNKPANGPTSSPSREAGEGDRYQEVDLDSLELVNPRSVGVEHAALSAIRQCALQDKLTELGLNRAQIAAAVGNIVARMAQPCSELATHAWLKDTSALGELLDFDFEKMDLNRLYRELGDIFAVPLRPHNRWGGFKSLRERWLAHLETTRGRAVLLIDEAQEMSPAALCELRLMASARFDSQPLLCVVLAGDARLIDKLRREELIPLGSRIRTRLATEHASREDLLAALNHLLAGAGNASLMTPALRHTLCDHAAGNYRILTTMAAELLAAATQRELPQLDEKLYLEVFAQPEAAAPRRTAARR